MGAARLAGARSLQDDQSPWREGFAPRGSLLRPAREPTRIGSSRHRVCHADSSARLSKPRAHKRQSPTLLRSDTRGPGVQKGFKKSRAPSCPGFTCARARRNARHSARLPSRAARRPLENPSKLATAQTPNGAARDTRASAVHTREAGAAEARARPAFAGLPMRSIRPKRENVSPTRGSQRRREKT